MKQKLLFLSILILLFGSGLRSWGQTNPSVQSLPYSQNFSSLTGVSPAFPAGWQGWTISGSLSTSFPTTAPNGDQAISVVTNTSTSAHVGDFIGKLGVMSTGNTMRSICLAINTTGLTSISVSFTAATQRTENTRQNELGLQYRIGSTGTFTNVSGSTYQNQMTPTNTTGTGAVKVETITCTLPAACNNQSTIQLRWLIRDISGSGNRPGFSIDDISISGTSGSNSISTGLVSTSPFCVDASSSASGSVLYSALGTYSSATFTAYLSDATGSFASPLSIGTSSVSGTDPSGSINFTIPAGTSSGASYKIRIDCNSPAVTGSESAALEIINGAKNVSAQAATVANQLSVVSWTNPSGCYDEIMVVGKAGGAVSAAPSGDGSAYSANLAFGSGSSYDGGFVLYKGTTSPQTVSALTNGTTYYFTFYTRKGENWSNGVSTSATPMVLPSLTEIIVPQYIQGMNGTNNNRIPFAYRVQLNDLSPNTTYRYINQVINSGDGTAVSGAGNAIFVKQSGDFVRTTGPSLSTSNNYGEFTTNESGSFTGWFITEPTANARFTPGQPIWMRIILNNGAGGTTAVTYLTTTSSTVVVNFGTTASATEGSALFGASFATSKDFVFLYDNTSGTGRPIYGSFVESDGVDLSAVTSIAQFYKDNVDGQGGYWGTIIPNVNANGIRRIEYRHLSDGTLFYASTDNDGNWNGLNTVNPTAGATALEISDNVADDFTIGTASSIYLPATFNLTVNGTLTNNAGTSGLVIESDATGTGSLLHNTANVPATIQRYITGNSNLTAYDYHLVSVPLDAAVTSAQFTGSYLYYFDPVSGWQSMGTSTTTPVPVDKGYMIYYPDAATTYNFTGELNNGTFTASTPMTATGQFALVPNPYPSAIDWDAAGGWTRTNLLDAIWIWDPVANQYAAYGAGVGTNGGTQYIPVGQAFFVKSNAAAPVLTMDNNVRVHNTQAFWKAGETEKDLIRVKAYANGMSDEILVRFRDYGLSTFDATDVDKLNGSDQAPQLYFLSSDQRALCINTLPYSTETVTVDMGMQLMADGTVTLVFSGFEFFEAGASIFLEDLLTGQMTDLRANPSYAFEHSQGNDPLRFRLHFMGVTATAETAENSLKVWNTADRIFFSLPQSEAQQALVEQLDLLGRVIHSEQMRLGTVNSINTTANGVVLLRVTDGNKVFTHKLFIR